MKKKSTLALLTLSTFVLMSGTIDLNQLFNYANQPIPKYISKDNSPADNPISDAGATLGRVLFYDKKLSLDNSVACASCHRQAFAFSDTAVLSRGIGGKTGRHSMRLVNARFSEENHFFWNERAATLEKQVTMPIRDALEMGFSGEGGQPDFDSLLRKLERTDYYPKLFKFAFGDSEINEQRMQKALAQFIRSIQSFDSKYDIGRAQVQHDSLSFPNFSPAENEGKRLFLTLPQDGGGGCFRCHNPPEFSIDPATLNNGNIEVAGQPSKIDLTNTRAPSLRDLVNPQGKLNGQLMHNGEFTFLFELVSHYAYLTPNPANTNLDPRLSGAANKITLSKGQKEMVVSFLKTLTGKQIYSDEKWADPFDVDGKIEVLPLVSGTSGAALADFDFQIFPNPSFGKVHLRLPSGDFRLEIFDASGRLVRSANVDSSVDLDLSGLAAGVFSVAVFDLKTGRRTVQKLIKI